MQDKSAGQDHGGENGLCRTAFKYAKPLRDLKASNAEQRYLSGLSAKFGLWKSDPSQLKAEAGAVCVLCDMVLKLGIASVALTGSVLLVQGSIDVLTLFLFLMAASRMYDPMQGALQNLAAVIAMRTNVGRMNEILDAPLQTGSEQLTNQGCDIVFDHVGFAYNSGETVLRDVSFTAKGGGHGTGGSLNGSRANRTTFRLAARFWDYQKAASPWAAWISQKSTRKSSAGHSISIVFQDLDSV